MFLAVRRDHALAAPMTTIATPTTINTSDLAGILMVAVQTLERRTNENAELKARIERLERAVGNMPTQSVSTETDEKAPR